LEFKFSIPVINTVTFIFPNDAFIPMNTTLQLQIKPEIKVEEPKVEVLTVTNLNLITARADPD